jgi:hypothetical protein
MSRKSLTCNTLEYTVDVQYLYSYDRGQHTFSNGDPGYSASESIDIISIVNADDKQPIDDDQFIAYDFDMIKDAIRREEGTL